MDVIWRRLCKYDLRNVYVQANSVQCTVCKKWIHKRCSGVRGDLSRVADGFRCRRCVMGQSRMLI